MFSNQQGSNAVSLNILAKVNIKHKYTTYYELYFISYSYIYACYKYINKILCKYFCVHQVLLNPFNMYYLNKRLHYFCRFIYKFNILIDITR